MRTLVLSDLHLGSRTDADVLRRAATRDALIDALRADPPERLVLLGDTLELRHGPVADALDAARAFLQGLGEALGAGGEVVLVPGNHDHALIATWLERRALARRTDLSLEEWATPAEASGAAEAIGEMVRPATLRVAYPGVWLREDVYATHGHYLDRHVTIPTFERLASGVMARVVGRLPDHGTGPEDYEAALAPLYAWLHVVARHTRTGFGAARQRGTQNAWLTLTATGRRPLRQRALKAGFPFAVRGLRRAGMGPLSDDVSPQELRRAGLRAMGQVVRQLGVDARWVVFGHTHRPGPLARDDASEWRAGPDGPHLVNTGSWVHERAFLGPSGARGPYWPGTVVEVDDEPGSRPRLHNLLKGWEPS